MAETLRLEPVLGLRLQSLEKVNEFAFRALADGGLEAGAAYAAAVVAEELCTNVLEHSDARLLELEIGVRGAAAYVVVRDDGAPFNPPEAFRRAAEGFVLEEKTERRLGLYIVHQLCRSLTYRRDGAGLNIVEADINPDGAPLPVPEP